ncbi:MAG: hypothetical protein V4682_02410 [Patescibacteria group bacterium]
MKGRFESTGIPESRESKDRYDAVEELTGSLSDADMELFSTIISPATSEEERAVRIAEFNKRMDALPEGVADAASRINGVPINFGGKKLNVSRDEFGRFNLGL